MVFFPLAVKAISVLAVVLRLCTLGTTSSLLGNISVSRSIEIALKIKKNTNACKSKLRNKVI
jgi:hypothetical protein